MNLDFDADQRALQSAVRDLLAAECSLDRVRDVFDGTEPFDRELWAKGTAMGWPGLVIDEQHGGSGMGLLEMAVLAEELGAALAPVPSLPSMYLATEAIRMAGSPEQHARWLPGLAAGTTIATFAVDESRLRHDLRAMETVFEDEVVWGVKAPVPDGMVADLAIVATNRGDDLVAVELTGAGVHRTELSAVDRSRGFARLSFAGAGGERLGSGGDGAHLLQAVHDRAAVLVAFEQIGGAQRCLELAADHARSRYTFGRPIGSYQAIKHKLADVYVAIELARSNAYYAAWAMAADTDELPIAACLARISATEAFNVAAEECLHVHGGLGFTWEHHSHLFLRRARLLSAALGAPRRWKHRLVDLLAARVSQDTPPAT